MSDEPGWITKRDAATLAEVDERTIERKARAGKITSKGRPGFPTRYWQADVEKLRQTAAQEVRTGILEAVTAAPSNGNGAGDDAGMRALRKPEVSYSGDDLIRGLAVLLSKALSHGPTGATGPTDGPTGPTALSPAERGAQYVTLQEAAAIKRVSERLLLRWIRNGSLVAQREPRSVWTKADRGWRIQRKDLEAL